MRPEVLVFIMKGCGACEQLKPLAQQLAAHYATCIDTRILDVNQHSGLADAMGVEETPTVIGVNAVKQPIARMVGHNGKPDRILKVYASVMQGVSSCTVQPFHDV